MEADGQRYKTLSGEVRQRGISGMAGRILAFVVGGIVVAGVLLFSVVLFMALLLVGLVFGGYLWWKTRALRRQLREQMQQAMQQARPPEGGDGVIEGEFVRETNDEHGQR